MAPLRRSIDTRRGPNEVGRERRQPGEPLEQLEPLDWRPRPTFGQRVRSAVGAPIAVGATLFAAAVVVAVLMVMLQPHDVSNDAHVGGGDLAGAGSPQIEADSDAESAAEARDAGTGETAGEILIVHVVGEVREPGVVELPAGARVRDAIDAAGGETEAAALAGVNLARRVSDGEQIVVPDTAGAAVGAPDGGGAEPAADDGMVDLNAADAATLETLPRVGPALAQRIIDWREANGGFASVDQLLDVSGIGQKTLDGLRDRVRV